MSTKTTLTDVLDNFRKNLTEGDVREVTRYIWVQAKCNATLETFSDFLKRLKDIAKQTLQDNVAKCIQALLFRELYNKNKQHFMNNTKKDASPEKNTDDITSKTTIKPIWSSNNATVIQARINKPERLHKTSPAATIRRKTTDQTI